MTAVLADLLSPVPPSNDGFAVVGTDLVVEKRASAVVRYDVTGLPGVRSLHGKLYAEPVRAAQVGRTLQVLAEHVYTDSPGLRVPLLLGSVPALGMVVCGSASGLPLDRLAEEPRHSGAQAAARWLALLHTAGVELDRRLDVAAEAQNWQSWAALVAARQPAAGPAAAELADRLVDTAAGVVPGPVVPIHKDFHHQHLLVGPEVTVLDLDEARMGDPALDVAHFCTYLDLWGLRRGTSMAGLRAGFLAAYSTFRPVPPAARLTFFAAYTWLKIAKQLVVGHGLHPVPDVLRCGEELAAVVARGLSCLRP